MTYFKGKCGEHFIKDNNYNISTKDGRSVLCAYNWNSLVKKGKVFVMSIKVEKVTLVERMPQVQSSTCPRCYKSDLGVMEDEGWLQW